jgi:hypothetical protein
VIEPWVKSVSTYKPPRLPPKEELDRLAETNNEDRFKEEHRTEWEDPWKNL